MSESRELHDESEELLFHLKYLKNLYKDNKYFIDYVDTIDDLLSDLENEREIWEQDIQEEDEEEYQEMNREYENSQGIY